MAERFKKDECVETKAGSRLRSFGRHPAIPELLMVETEDGFKTTVLITSLVDSPRLQEILAQPGPPSATSTDVPDEPGC